MKSFFLLKIFLLFFTIIGFTQTQIKFINSTSYTINAAYAKYTNKTTGWQTEGWWVLEPWEEVIVDVGNYKGTVYIYGMTTDGYNWGGGEYDFCINPVDAFKISNADKKKCGDNKRNFSEGFNLVWGALNSWTYYP